MAFGKSFCNRLLHCYKTTFTHSAVSQRTPSAFTTRILRERLVTSLDSPRRALYGQFHNHRAVDHSHEAKADPLFRITVHDARKILRLSRVERLKATLSDIPSTSISRSDFIRICIDACQNHQEGAELAKMLDDSGNVIVLGDVVFLRPQQVAETMEGFIRETMGHLKDPRRKELEAMEKQKSMIDEKAKALVRAELYCGLGFLVLQTLAFMRLTFWELSWDVMEPICFFFTSFHFALAYLFFLKTSTEPTFQSYFLRRFTTKQRRLMYTYHFDVHRYHQLCTLFYPNHHNSSVS